MDVIIWIVLYLCGSLAAVVEYWFNGVLAPGRSTMSLYGQWRLGDLKGAF